MYPKITSLAGIASSVLRSSSSRHFPSGSCTNTNWIDLCPAAGYQHTSRMTFTISFFLSPLGNVNTRFFASYLESFSICVGLGNAAPFLRLLLSPGVNGRVRLGLGGV